jgi:hypothetical protein
MINHREHRGHGEEGEEDWKLKIANLRFQIAEGL